MTRNSVLCVNVFAALKKKLLSSFEPQFCFHLQSFDGPASDSDVCSYHSGVPIFHEGLVLLVVIFPHYVQHFIFTIAFFTWKQG